IRLGDEAVKSVYTGDDLVWEKGQKPLILEYTITRDGSSSELLAILPFFNAPGRTVDWGDGNIEVRSDRWPIYPNHWYEDYGIYQVKIYGPVGGIRSANMLNEYKDRLTKIISWGADDIEITSLDGGFGGCEGLVSVAADKYGALRNIDNFEGMFQGCISLESVADDLFINAEMATNYNRCFSGCSKLTGYTPKGPGGLELWDLAVNGLSGSECFRDCNQLTNYSAIISGWK
ncbi:MAG: hypothetical protein LUF04_15290, partial [Bacteroides sp.]|nr:hypothetical protein [Bacteroides sp.]